MPVSAIKKDPIPFNGEMLRWARNWRQRSVVAAAKRAGVTPDMVKRWEDGKETPTVRQARLLADLYERPFLEFFSSDEPAVRMPELLPDFRLHRDAPAPPEENRELLKLQSWAEEQRLNALDLYELLGEGPTRFPADFTATITDDAFAVASRARQTLNFPIQEQTGLKSKDRDKFPDILRAKLEAIGVLTLKRAALKQFKARGLCIVVFPLPIIMLGNEAASAQAFTIVHELAHLVLRESAIIGAPASRRGPRRPRKIEQWCDRFASAFLMPEGELAKVIERPAKPEEKISDEKLRDAANTFAVSQHAMLIRLVQLGYVQASYYWKVKRPQFMKKEEEYKGFGRAPYYGSRYRTARGDLYTGLVMEAWDTGRITNHNAAEFMGIKNFRHLEDIRNHFW
jgi:Zn-dependent peptidase ImmA (M78 family)